MMGFTDEQLTGKDGDHTWLVEIRGDVSVATYPSVAAQSLNVAAESWSWNHLNWEKAPKYGIGNITLSGGGDAST